MCAVLVHKRAGGETNIMIEEFTEDSLSAGLKSAWKITALHNRNQIGTSLVRNIRQFRDNIRDDHR